MEQNTSELKDHPNYRLKFFPETLTYTDGTIVEPYDKVELDAQHDAGRRVRGFVTWDVDNERWILLHDGNRTQISAPMTYKRRRSERFKPGVKPQRQIAPLTGTNLEALNVILISRHSD